ncbi:rab11 family-interacting protein 5 isoform X1 [Dromiciops gliroides]|uniref:rab11 family-interacting protein 5 isoform X1 n=1 Tax=Dromiciops gliroides TaxID=33562 RepID=UPI001CC3C141|nr:rab11 family-interacting protein 5 isoform X1 [Dromiciops gliroides]
MALRRSPEPPGGPARWLPTHVQVTVLQARGLRGKGTGGSSTSDAYTVIQVGREKYSTSVVEKSTGCPEWREECVFELAPGALDGLLRAQDAAPAGPAAAPGPTEPACELVLTAMHRSLIGIDKFLGQATVALDEVFRQGRAQHTQWHKLHSKAGKKEKERGEIQVSIQFTRNNLSASMFDLSVKDKPRSPFGKIKDKMKGKKKYDLESASAIIPSSAMDDPDLLGGSSKKAKAKTFFLRNKLRKSSLTQSNTSLGSDSTISSTSGSLVWPGSEYLTRSPSRHSRLSTDGGRDSAPSPKLLTHKRAYSDEVSQVQAGLPRAGHDPGSGSSLCINGSHIYSDEPPAPPAHRASISGPFPSASSRAEEGMGPSDMAPWGSSEAGAAAGVGPEEEGARRAEGKPIQVATPMVFSSASAEKEDPRKEERKPRMGLFHHHHHGLGRRGSLGEKMGPASGASPHPSSSGEEKGRSGWFGSREGKEHTQKPSGSLVAAPTVSSPSEWDDSFNAFAASRLPSDAGCGFSAPAAESGLLEPEPGAWGAPRTGGDNVAMTAEAREDPRGGGSNSASTLEAPGPPSPDGWSVTAVGWESPVLQGPSPSLSARQHSLGQNTEEGEGPSRAPETAPEAACPGPLRRENSGQERSWSPGASEELEEETAARESQLSQELNVITDLWSSEMINIPPVSKSPPPISKRNWEQEENLWGLLDEPPSLWGPDSPSPGDPAREVFSPPLEQGEGSPASQQESSEELRPGPPPPKPPRLFTPSNSQNEERDVNPRGPSREGMELRFEDIFPSLRALSHRDEMEGADLAPQELDTLRSGSRWEPLPEPLPLLPEPGPPPAVPELPSPSLASKHTADRGQPLWAAEEPESGHLPDTPEPPGFLAAADLGQPLWAAEEPESGHLPDTPEPPGLLAATNLGQPLWAAEEPESGNLPDTPEPPGLLAAADLGQPLWAAEEPESGHLPDTPEPPGLLAAAASVKEPIWDSSGDDDDTLSPSLPHGSPASTILPASLPATADEASPAPPSLELVAPQDPTPAPPLPPPLPSPCPATNVSRKPGQESLSLHGSRPLSFSTPALADFPTTRGPFEFPSPIEGSPSPQWGIETPSTLLALLPLETRPAEEPPSQRGTSPHPVKPLSSAPPEGVVDKKPPRSSLSSALTSGLEKLKTVTSGSIQPVAPQADQTAESKVKLKQDPSQPDQSARYYHLTHDELIALLLQRERELSRRDEHVHELESYIDQLLVRIMETSPTLLQIPQGPRAPK